MHRTCQNKESVPESQHPAAYRQRTALKRYRKSESETLMCCPYHARQLIERHSQLHYLTISIKCWLLQSTIKQKYQDKIICKRENPYEKLLIKNAQEQWSTNHGTQQTQNFSLQLVRNANNTSRCHNITRKLGYRSNTMQRNSKSNQQK